MLSVLIPSKHSYPAMPRARQLVDQRFVHPDPLVHWTTSLKYQTPAADRDQSGSRRSEPSSRNSLIGEQPTYYSFIAKSIDYIFRALNALSASVNVL